MSGVHMDSHNTHYLCLHQWDVSGGPAKQFSVHMDLGNTVILVSLISQVHFLLFITNICLYIPATKIVIITAWPAEVSNEVNGKYRGKEHTTSLVTLFKNSYMVPSLPCVHIQFLYSD